LSPRGPFVANQETVLLNASVGVQRALDRLRPVSGHRSPVTQLIHHHSVALAHGLRGLVLPDRPRDPSTERTPTGIRPAVVIPALRVPSTIRRGTVHHRRAPKDAVAVAGATTAAPVLRTAAVRRARRTLISRVGPQRAVPAMAVSILAVAVAVSSAPALGESGAVGGTSGDAAAARITAGGINTDAAGTAAFGGPDGTIDDTEVGLGIIASGPDEEAAGDTRQDPGPIADAVAAASPEAGTLDDGTLLKPVAVDTTVADGKGLMRSYRVRAGDTLTGIARKFGVSMMTVWWANNLRHKDDLHIGQMLTIPPVSGVVITVTSADTLESLAARYGVAASEIIDANRLDDPNLVIGQTLTVPGARGAAIATPTPAPKPKATKSSSGSRGGSSGPSRYSGGSFAWPVAGGSISQYYHYGHYGLDIQAPSGTRVFAAASGTVIFAGWKSNGGGYQVWISHGSNLYTTYNHMSSVSVGRGQHVGRGQQVGRVGSTGYATGPHLHFEVWKGPIWNGGTRVNPLAYL
jgi:murein DD-endopeptidase MepM/ murein hydrolase activator NlpD